MFSSAQRSEESSRSNTRSTGESEHDLLFNTTSKTRRLPSSASKTHLQMFLWNNNRLFKICKLFLLPYVRLSFGSCVPQFIVHIYMYNIYIIIIILLVADVRSVSLELLIWSTLALKHSVNSWSSLCTSVLQLLKTHLYVSFKLCCDGRIMATQRSVNTTRPFPDDGRNGNNYSISAQTQTLLLVSGMIKWFLHAFGIL